VKNPTTITHNSSLLEAKDMLKDVKVKFERGGRIFRKRRKAP